MVNNVQYGRPNGFPFPLDSLPALTPSRLNLRGVARSLVVGRRIGKVVDRRRETHVVARTATDLPFVESHR